MSSRRRRRASAADAEDDPPPAPEPPAPADGSDDEDDEDLPQGDTSTRQTSLVRRSMRSSTRRTQRRERRVIDEHQPSAAARFVANMRSTFFGQRDHYFYSRYQIASSTPLQMTLYFNIPYAIIYAGINQLLFSWKSANWDLPLVVAVVSPMVFWVWAFVEPIRLLLGYVGNLKERVAWLGGFWVLSIFPQICVHAYFIVAQDYIGWFSLPIEVAMSSIYLVLVLAQLFLSYSTVKRLIAKAMADFHLTPLDSDDANASL